jgi:hypothetical protein
MEGTILDLASRKPIPPIPELQQVFQSIPRTSDFEMLPEMRRLR